MQEVFWCSFSSVSNIQKNPKVETIGGKSIKTLAVALSKTITFCNLMKKLFIFM